jgi:hypothetical protein
MAKKFLNPYIIEKIYYEYEIIIQASLLQKNNKRIIHVD